MRADTHVIKECQRIEKFLTGAPHLRALTLPSSNYYTFLNALETSKPRLLHLISHADTESFQFEGADESAVTEIPIGELIDDLKFTPSLAVVILGTCSSATRTGSPSAAEKLARATGASVIGFNGNLPPTVALAFSRGFYATLLRGVSLGEAFWQGQANVRDLARFRQLWSSWIMYSPDSTLIPFPSTTTARTRFAIDEVVGRLNDLKEIVEVFENSPYAIADSLPQFSAEEAYLHDRLQRLRDLAAELKDLQRRHDVSELCADAIGGLRHAREQTRVIRDRSLPLSDKRKAMRALSNSLGRQSIRFRSLERQL